jgi:hypothetical protein
MAAGLVIRLAWRVNILSPLEILLGLPVVLLLAELTRRAAIEADKKTPGETETAGTPTNRTELPTEKNLISKK